VHANAVPEEGVRKGRREGGREGGKEGGRKRRCLPDLAFFIPGACTLMPYPRRERGRDGKREGGSEGGRENERGMKGERLTNNSSGFV